MLELVGAESEAGKRYSKQSVEHFLMVRACVCVARADVILNCLTAFLQVKEVTHPSTHQPTQTKQLTTNQIPPQNSNPNKLKPPPNTNYNDNNGDTTGQPPREGLPRGGLRPLRRAARQRHHR